MKKKALLIMGAVGALMGMLAIGSALRAGTITPPPRVTVRAAQYEAMLTQLDPDLTEITAQLGARVATGRAGDPERRITWMTDDGTTMTARIWVSEANGKSVLHTAVEAQREVTAAMDQSFNLQYLNLQQQVQDESRRFTLISNILKSKHEASKSSIGNMR